MKKVLFITYYWPPSGKASIHFPLDLIRHISGFGIEPVVLTVENESFTQPDLSLLKKVPENLRVYKSKSYEPFELYKRFTGKRKDEQLVASETISKTNKSLTHRISIWIRLNLFIPDARIGWYFSACAKGGRIVEDEKIDAVVTIGPPHSTHLVGRRLSKKYGVKHIPVFIDPWVDIVYYKDFKRSRLTLDIDNGLEKIVLKDSFYSVFVTETMMQDYIKKYPFLKNKSRVIHWGYSDEDFDGVKPKRNDEEVLLHSGNIFDFQNVPEFWKTLKEEIDKGRKLKIKFTGTVSPGVRESIAAAGLNEHVDYLGFLPYEELLTELLSADYLLVCATEKRHLPGKLFEYLKTGKKIIAFGEDNEEVKEIITKANAGMMFGYNDSGKEFFDNAGSFNTNFEEVYKFNRKIAAEKLAEVIKK